MSNFKERLSNVRPSSIVKTIVYTVYSLILVSTVTSFLPSFGYRGSAPDLILCATIAIAYCEGERVAAVFGMLSGFLLEAAGSTGFSMLPLFYMITGCVCAMLFLNILGKNIGAYLIYIAGFALVRAAITIIYIQFTVPDFGLGTALSRVVLPEYGVTLLASPLIFPITCFIHRRLSGKAGIQEGRLS